MGITLSPRGASPSSPSNLSPLRSPLEDVTRHLQTFYINSPRPLTRDTKKAARAGNQATALGGLQPKSLLQAKPLALLLSKAPPAAHRGVPFTAKKAGSPRPTETTNNNRTPKTTRQSTKTNITPEPTTPDLKTVVHTTPRTDPSAKPAAPASATTPTARTSRIPVFAARPRV